ncbi:23S rRNA pseudouridine(955/2504/2580) synthase RluC [Buchnera aphidicola (Pemphigus obesinymphae)]|uniref:23S rRNA pseudouridine(955/2504/2580) synthase RluC n=1 Tax=Buchnera aphidicola TaxID=9 RepID=UPI0022389A28|nr:23S rRNA pseudouridine(955/2504/2580) synthase RluC [Buchnera aphidicola]MCW5196607.1 23S rRNA pseudouridine(955/2504/2580) synthase RluC [Buchnera aphidicola (Pemphigus obesinymphae)]
MKKKILNIQTVSVTEAIEKQRIDNFLIKKLKTIPKSMIYRIIRTGKVKINKKKIKPKYKLAIGDQITIPSIDITEKIIKKNTITNIILHKKQIENIFKNILYEDKYLLIINKPSGIAVHGGSGINFGIIEILRKLKPENYFLELVHRLDRDTSGILILAKKRSTLRNLHQQLREKKIKKIYITLVHGQWPKNKKSVTVPLLKTKLFNQKNVVKISEKGKKSETQFFIKQQYINHTLLLATPITGRTHQIRVHTAHTGYPIVFDSRYGKKNLDLKLKNKNLKNRLLLHSHKVSFIHPYYKHNITILAPLEKQFKKYLNLLL